MPLNEWAGLFSIGKIEGRNIKCSGSSQKKFSYPSAVTVLCCSIPFTTERIFPMRHNWDWIKYTSSRRRILWSFGLNLQSCEASPAAAAAAATIPLFSDDCCKIYLRCVAARSLCRGWFPPKRDSIRKLVKCHWRFAICCVVMCFIWLISAALFRLANAAVVFSGTPTRRPTSIHFD